MQGPLNFCAVLFYFSLSPLIPTPIPSLVGWYVFLEIHAYLVDVVGPVPDHCNQANIAMKRITQIFFQFPSAYKSCLHYTVVY